MTLTGKTKLAGVMGWPVGHSRSPRLHGHWLTTYGIDGAYVPLAVKPEGLERAVRGLAALGFAGCNVTVPHKVPVMAMMTHVDDHARRMGAVNTVVVNDDGTLSGSNTDGYGFLENLRQSAPGWRADAGPAVVLGAGGAARAVLVALIDAGVREIRVVNRTAARAEALAAALGGKMAVTAWAEREAALDGAALLVNTTTLGMTGQPPLDLDLKRLPTTAAVNDIVYAPLETPLLRAARARGNVAVDGLGMLLHQARPGFKAWFGPDPQVTEDLRRFVAQGL